MSRDTLVNILYAIGVAGGVILFLAPFMPRIKACSSRHHRVAMLFCGIATTAWASFGLIDRTLHPRLSRHVDYMLHHYKDMCSGAALSILLLQFASGEFISACRRDKQLRKQSPNETPTNVA